jgi:rhomboid family GlyGly-CTERM serine protease
MKNTTSTFAATGRLITVSLSLAVIAVVVHLVPGAREWLQYDRSLIAAGEIWRIITCHWTHWSLDHLFWDAAALAVLGTLCERLDRRRFIACLLTVGVVIPAVVWLFIPDMQTYRGLSGIDSALFALFAILMLKRPSIRKTAGGYAILLLLVLGIAKVIFELSTGTTLFVDGSENHFIPVPLAHLAGGLVGLAVAFLPTFPPRPHSQKNYR